MYAFLKGCQNSCAQKYFVQKQFYFQNSDMIKISEVTTPIRALMSL